MPTYHPDPSHASTCAVRPGTAARSTFEAEPFAPEAAGAAHRRDLTPTNTSVRRIHPHARRRPRLPCSVAALGCAGTQVPFRHGCGAAAQFRKRSDARDKGHIAMSPSQRVGRAGRERGWTDWTHRGSSSAQGARSPRDDPPSVREYCTPVYQKSCLFTPKAPTRPNEVMRSTPNHQWLPNSRWWRKPQGRVKSGRAAAVPPCHRASA